MNSSNGMQYSLNLTGSLASDKLGVTTTVKQQVQNIELALDTFKRAIDAQKKSQNQLQLQLKKLDQKTHNDFEGMLRQTNERVGQLTDNFKNENYKQSKEFQYLQLQDSTLQQEHSKLRQIGQDINLRTSEIQKRVGV